MTNYSEMKQKSLVAMAHKLADICMLCDSCDYRLADGSCGAGWHDCAEKWERWLRKRVPE